MFPEVPGSAELVLASPLFQHIAITSTDGRRFTIDAPDASDANFYVQSLTLNGQPWNTAALPPSFANHGGKLSYVLGSSANTSWAAGAAGSPRSYSTGQLPAIGFTNPAATATAVQGVGTSITVGAQNVTDSPVSVRWKAVPSSGVSVSPASGTVTAPPAAAGTASVTATSASGSGSITFTFTAGGKTLPPVVLELSQGAGCALPATPPPPASDNLSAFFDDPGISRDCNPTEGNFDFEGYSYSEDALTAAGLAPGAAVESGGITYHWPSVAPGQPDNVVASGQTVVFSAASSSATKLGVLGSATNGDTQAAATVLYADGTTQSVQIGLSDWTLGAGNHPPSYGNEIVANVPYRNWELGPQQVSTYIFSTTVPLLAGKTVQSVTLPAPAAGNNALHIFAIGLG
jgi:hypothetical protein